jgi:hypothetical protein
MIESYFLNGHHDLNGAWVYQIEPAFQEFMEKFQNAVVLYEHFSETLRYTVHRFRKSDSVQRKFGSDRPKVHIETVQHRMEDEPQLPLKQLSQQTDLSVSTCQRIDRKDLEDSVTAERKILGVFIYQFHDDELARGYFNKTRLHPIQHGRLFVICNNF